MELTWLAEPTVDALRAGLRVVAPDLADRAIVPRGLEPDDDPQWCAASAPRMSEGDPSALSLYGMLHLRSAVAAARHQDRSIANELLGKAEVTAETLGEDANYWQTGFGPTNVALHRMSAGLDLGDIPFVVEHAAEVDTGAMPVERQVTHMIDHARALSLVARDDDALQVLLTAEDKSPQLVRHSAIAREVVRTLYRRAPVTGGKNSSLLLALAKRCRAVREG